MSPRCWKTWSLIYVWYLPRALAMERWVALRVRMRLTQCRLQMLAQMLALKLAAWIALKSAQMLAPQSAAQFARQRLAPSSNIKRCKETCGHAF